MALPTPSRRPPVQQVARPPEAGAAPHRENWPEVGVPSRHAIKRSGGQPGLGVHAGFATGCCAQQKTARVRRRVPPGYGVPLPSGRKQSVARVRRHAFAARRFSRWVGAAGEGCGAGFPLPTKDDGADRGAIRAINPWGKRPTRPDCARSDACPSRELCGALSPRVSSRPPSGGPRRSGNPKPAGEGQVRRSTSGRRPAPGWRSRLRRCSSLALGGG